MELRRTCYNALLKTPPSTTVPPFAFLRSLGPISPPQPQRMINITAPEDLTFNLIRPTGKLENKFTIEIITVKLTFGKIIQVIPPNPMARIINPPAASEPESLPDAEVLQKMNDIIKDRSAECKPRKVPIYFYLKKMIFIIGFKFKNKYLDSSRDPNRRQHHLPPSLCFG